MGEILDNQEVTTQTLNNIAIDLGATTFSAFSGEKFGVDKLNDITKALVGKGITQSVNKCEPYISGGDLYINTGTIIFSSGAKIRITSPLKVEIQNGTYIYALNSTDTNMAEIVVSETAPTTGDYVKIAAVDASGGLTDLREWAQSNVLLASNQSVTKTIDAKAAPITLNVGTSWTTLLWSHSYCRGTSWKVIAENNVKTKIYIFEDVDRIGTFGFYVTRDGSNVIFEAAEMPNITMSTAVDFTFI